MTQRKLSVALYVYALAAFAPSAHSQSLTSLYFSSADHAYYVAANQHICEFYITSSGWVSNDITAASNQPNRLAAPGSSVTSLVVSGGDHVYYFDASWHLSQLYPTSSGWVNQDISAAATPSGAAAAPGSPLTSAYFANADQIFYVAANQHIIHFLVTSQGWTSEDMMVTTGTNVPVASGTALSGSSAGDGTGRIYYIAANQHINVLLWNTQNWINEDWTTFSGNKALASVGSAISGFTAPDGTTRLFYLDRQPHVTEVWWTTRTFLNEDLTAESGTSAIPTPASGLSSFAGPNGTAYVYYVDKQQHVNQLGWNGQTWSNQDLTVATGFQLSSNTIQLNPLATPQTALTSLLISGGNHVYYVDVNGHVNQIYWNGQKWVNQDLTALGNGPVVSSVGSGSALPYVREYIYGPGQVIAIENGQFGHSPGYTLINGNKCTLVPQSSCGLGQ